MEFNYLKEKRRMLNSIGRKGSACLGAVCDRCPISYKNNKRNRHCAEFEMLYPEQATEEIRKWAEKHPRKTYKEDFLEKYPNAPLKPGGEPSACIVDLGYVKCDGTCAKPNSSCRDCWNEEIEE